MSKSQIVLVAFNHSVPQSIRTCPVRISRELHRMVKIRAAELGIQIQDLVEPIIRKALKK